MKFSVCNNFGTQKLLFTIKLCQAFNLHSNMCEDRGRGFMSLHLTVSQHTSSSAQFCVSTLLSVTADGWDVSMTETCFSRMKLQRALPQQHMTAFILLNIFILYYSVSTNCITERSYVTSQWRWSRWDTLGAAKMKNRGHMLTTIRKALWMFC